MRRVSSKVESTTLPLSNVDRGRLMAQTAASIRTIDAWWRGERVLAVTRNALEKAAKRLRIMVPHPATTIGAKTRGLRESQRPPAAAGE